MSSESEQREAGAIRAQIATINDEKEKNNKGI